MGGPRTRGQKAMNIQRLADHLNEMESTGKLDIETLNRLLNPPLFVSRSSDLLHGLSGDQFPQSSLPTPTITSTESNETDVNSRTSSQRSTEIERGEEEQVRRNEQSSSTSGREEHAEAHHLRRPTNTSTSRAKKRFSFEDIRPGASKLPRMGDTEIPSAAMEVWEILGTSTMSHELPAQKIRLARERFVSKWGKKTKAIGEWTKLDKYAYISKEKTYEPYEELEDLMGRVWDIGGLRVQVHFRSLVYAWIKDHQDGTKVEAPEHLKHVERLGDPSVLQELYMSFEMADEKCKLEGSAQLLARSAAAEGKIKIPFGYTIRTQAKMYILQTIYQTDEENAKKRLRFDNLRKWANLWYFLVQRYDNAGILALIPEEQTEVSLRLQSRWPALLDILDLLRPDFHGPRLRVYSQIIDQMAHGQIPDKATLLQLDYWTSPARAALQIMDNTQPYEPESDLHQPIYNSLENKHYVESLPELERENFILERCTRIQQTRQDGNLAAIYEIDYASRTGSDEG
ncbi:MAG: hypothetical protein Q9166_004930 [cf. Caloplaca sp. 2 TL-2023]